MVSAGLTKRYSPRMGELQERHVGMRSSASPVNIELSTLRIATELSHSQNQSFFILRSRMSP